MSTSVTTAPEIDLAPFLSEIPKRNESEVPVKTLENVGEIPVIPNSLVN